MNEKLMSGRWLMTISAAGVFVYCSVTKLLNAETITAILMFVFQSYFAKKEDSK